MSVKELQAEVHRWRQQNVSSNKALREAQAAYNKNESNLDTMQAGAYTHLTQPTKE